MAGEDRTPTQALEFFQSLSREPYRYGLFRTLRRVECLRRDLPRLGEAAKVTDEPLRLGQEVSLAFAPATIAAVTPPGGGKPARLSVFSFGLFGPNGPVPLHLSEYARDRLRNAGDPAFVRFADLFHHRLLSLFYRGWARCQPAVSFDRPEEDRFAVYLGSLFGLGQDSLRNRDSVPDLTKLYHANLFALGTRPADGLLRLVSSFFGLPVEIEEFVGQWIDLPGEAVCRLEGDGRGSRLGETTTIGSRVWDCQQKFRIILGPMGRDDYQRLLPGSPARRRLVDLVRGYLGDELAWDLRLVLRKEDVPPLRLGGTNRLGWSTWLQSGPATEDAGDLVLDLLADEAAEASEARPQGEGDA